ncbi:MAG: aminoacyl-tRNA hydrolase [Alphaproteobacteria bacterium]|jgi:PTH1 family peptidyl-tRNA hydrolase|nr:aminoacyl-tRNA hydrolase [Alphaproteobacteria bacterium]
MILLVGLGNPGPRYAYHRHNIGFMALDDIVERHRFAPFRSKFRGQLADGELAGVRTLAFKPMTFMNESGRAVGEAVRFFKLEPGQVTVIHDDLDLAPGRCRVKRGGGAGGHNGLRSLDSQIGKEYWRVRLGIGHPGDKTLVHNYVLHDFGSDEEAWLDPLLEAVARAIPLLVEGTPDKFMTKVALETRPDGGGKE